MAEIGGGQEGDGVGQAQAHPRAQQQQHADVNGCGCATHQAVAQQAVQHGHHAHGRVAALQQGLNQPPGLLFVALDEVFEALGGRLVGTIGNHPQHQPGDALLLGHLRDGGAFHLNGPQVGQGIPQRLQHRWIADEAIPRGDQTAAGPSESVQIACAVGLQQSGLGPVEPSRLRLEPVLVQCWQREAWEQGPGIHVVLHHGIGQHHIPLAQGWIRSAGNAGEHQQIDAGIAGEQACGGPRSAHLAPAAPGQAEAHRRRPTIPCGSSGRRGRCSSDP